jgi:hypothetical protein
VYRPEIRGPLRLGDGGEKEQADQHHHQHLQQQQVPLPPSSDEGTQYVKVHAYQFKGPGSRYRIQIFWQKSRSK